MAKGLVGKAIVFSFLSKYITMGLQFVSMVILARLITPEEFGIYSISYILITMVEVFKQYGVTSYLIKEKDINSEIIGSAYHSLLIIAFIAAIGTFFLADQIANFYQADSLALIIKILSINILISPFGTVISTLLNREMNFSATLVATSISLLLGTSLTIYLAYNGFGAFSLALGAVLQTASSALILQFYRQQVPKFVGNNTHIRSILNYSKHISFFGVLGNIGHNASQLIAGRFFTLQEVGQLSRASNSAALFSKVFSQALSPIISPLVARTKHQNINLRDSLHPLLIFQLTFAWPFYICLCLYSHEIVYIVYGETWLECAIFLSFFCISRIIFSFTEILDPVFIGIGLSRPMTNSALFLNISRIIICLVFANIGILEMIMAVTLMTPLMRTAIYCYMLKEYTGIGFKEYISWIKKPLVLLMTQIMIFSVYYYLGFSEDPTLSIEFVISIALSVLSWAACCYFLRLHITIIRFLKQ